MTGFWSGPARPGRYSKAAVGRNSAASTTVAFGRPLVILVAAANECCSAIAVIRQLPDGAFRKSVSNVGFRKK